MATTMTTFAKVPVMGFFYNPLVGLWMVKVSRRRATTDGTWRHHWEPGHGQAVRVLA